ncbi:MAG: nucleotide exchange factor GrpE [Dehalococcoidia bacterium]|nr:nucleotide exchange factor GrpE [Dehalococcoidia bacterium]
MVDEKKDDASGVAEPDAADGDGQSALDLLQAQLDEAIAEKERYHRAYSDAVDFSRRAGERHTAELQYAAAPVLMQLLSSVDDLERAFGSIPDSLLRMTWVEGILLIYRKLQGALESSGVTEIETAGGAFDPNLHEAISRVPGPEGRIVEVLQKGYMLHDRVLRPALVQVGDGSGVEQASGESDTDNASTDES